MTNSLIKTVANIITSQLIGLSEKTGKPINDLITPQKLLELSQLYDEKQINNKGLQLALDFLLNNPQSTVSGAVNSLGIIQTDDSSILLPIVAQIIEENQKAVNEYKSGKTQVIGYLVGQCMKLSKGSGNPKKFEEILLSQLQD